MKDYRNQIIIHDLEAMEVMEWKCNIMGTFIQGSQNYMLDYEGSDVDSISLAVPSFKSLCLEEQKFSFTHVRQNNEHIDIKDFRLIFGSWLKQNVKYLEILFSKYNTIDERYRVVWDSITENREKISRYDQIRGVKCCFGMAMEKYKALKHPYPSIIEKIEKHGYDPKQLHHIVRLSQFIEDFYIEGKTFEESLIPEDRQFLIELKTNAMPLELAEKVAMSHIRLIEDMRKEVEEKYKDHMVDEEVEELLNEATVDIFMETYDVR
jgi:hypothetical protein